jgi:hypothetical protein
MAAPVRFNANPRIAALVVALFFLTGCVPTPSFYLAPEYRNVRHSEVSILVLPYVLKLMTPDQSELFIDRKTKENKLITNLEVELYEGYFQILLSEKTHARVLPYDKATNRSTVRLRTQATESGIKPKMILFVPHSGSIQVNGETPDYLFVIQDLFFMKGRSEGLSSRIPGGGGMVDYVLEAGIDYLIWDNKKEKTVAFGSLSNRTRLLAPPDKEHYLKVMEEFAASVVKNSPFAEKKISF